MKDGGAYRGLRAGKGTSNRYGSIGKDDERGFGVVERIIIEALGE